MKIFKKMGKYIGPGVVTGAADDDPSGIATYSQTGAQFGFGQLWTVFFMLPILIAIQEASARIGAVTGKGIAAVIKQHYSKYVLYSIVFLLFIANTINVAADIGAMAATTQLLIPIPFFILTLLFTIIILTLIIFIPYKKYVYVLQWLTLSLIAYPLTLLIVQVPWITALKAMINPHLEFNFHFLMIITAVLGTTISPYLFFWQASQEVEEKKDSKSKSEHKGLKKYIVKLRIDNFIGMLSSQITTWCIIVVSATVLHANNVTDITTAADAAKALEPLVQSFPHAGFISKFIFSIGIIGLGLLGVPVLAGSVAYGVSEVLSWREGLNLKLKNAIGFYSVIIIISILGLSINFIKIDPFKLLIYSAVINGIIAVPLIFMIGLIAKNEKILGKHKSKKLSQIFVGLTFLIMALACIGMVATLIK